MNKGDKVIFTRDVTRFDLFEDEDDADVIVVPIWSVGVVMKAPENGHWACIDPQIEGVIKNFGYPLDCYEVILPTPQ